jgi:aryl-alcohol dehydrogenase-like predicted oxidoreductase
MTKTEPGLGCWQFAGSFGFWEDQRFQDSVKVIHHALRNGIRHFDTAQGYGNGKSEQIVGQQLKRFSQTISRDRLIVATKIMPKTATQVEKDLDKSLRRLCMEYVDILYLHWPSSRTDLFPLLDAMAGTMLTGKARAIGLCNVPPELLASFGDYPIGYVQMPCNLLWTKGIGETLSYCRENGIKTVGYSPLGLGLLNGTHRERPTDGRSGIYCYDSRSYGAFVALVDCLHASARENGCSPAQVAIAWALAQGFDWLLVGNKTKEQLSENLASRTVMLSARQLDDLTECSRRLVRTAPSSQDNLFGHRW